MLRKARYMCLIVRVQCASRSRTDSRLSKLRRLATAINVCKRASGLTSFGLWTMNVVVIIRVHSGDHLGKKYGEKKTLQKRKFKWQKLGVRETYVTCDHYSTGEASQNANNPRLECESQASPGWIKQMRVTTSGARDASEASQNMNNLLMEHESQTSPGRRMQKVSTPWVDCEVRLLVEQFDGKVSIGLLLQHFWQTYCGFCRVKAKNDNKNI